MNLFGIFLSVLMAQQTVDNINNALNKSAIWQKTGTVSYGYVIPLKDGTFAVEIIKGYEIYFPAQVVASSKIIYPAIINQADNALASDLAKVVVKPK